MERLHDDRTPLQQVADYSVNYLALKQRKDRSLVKTRYGEQIGDPQLRNEWAVVNAAMDFYLERLFAGTVELEPVQE